MIRRRPAVNMTLQPENVKKIKIILADQGLTLSSYVDAVIEDALRRYKKNRLPLAPEKMDLGHITKTFNKALKFAEKHS